MQAGKRRRKVVLGSELVAEFVVGIVPEVVQIGSGLRVVIAAVAVMQLV